MYTPSNKIIVTVVVSTRNRSKSLRKCLLSLVNQSAPADVFEVLIVDNNSSDDTAEVISDIVKDHQHVRSCRENTLGLSCARNRGLKEGRGEYVAYIDDDAEAFPDWIQEMLAFLRRNGSVVTFGGPHEATVDTPLPGWFPPEFGTFELGPKEFSLNATTEFLCGTNMVFKRDVLLDIGGFSPDLGMSGNKLSYGEETRLQIDLKRLGYEIFYVPTLKVKHLIAPEKMKLQWLIRSVYAVGRCSSTTFCTQRTLVSCCAGMCYGLVHALRSFFTARNVPLRRNLYYSLRPLISETGALHEYLNAKFRQNARTSR